MKTGQLAPTARHPHHATTTALSPTKQVDVELFVPHTPLDLPETFVPRFDGTDVWPVLAEYVDDPSAAERCAPS